MALSGWGYPGGGYGDIGSYFNAPSPAEATLGAARLAHQADYTGGSENSGYYGSIPIAQYAQDLKQKRFNTVFGAISPFLSALNGSSTAGQFAGSGPAISAGPVWNPQQIQQQVNASRANTDTQTASQGRQASQSLAGRGFGSNSPLLAALQGNFAMAGAAQNADAERGIRLDSATNNAKQLLASQTARSDQDIGLKKIKTDQLSALLQALGGLS